MPVPSIPSFFEIQGDSSPVPGYNPDKRAQTLQPLSVFPLKENKWLPLLVLLFQTDAPTGTSSGSSFLYPVSGKTSQPFFFIMPFFTRFRFLRLLSFGFQPALTWFYQLIFGKVDLFPFAFSLVTLIAVRAMFTRIFIGIADIPVFLCSSVSGFPQPDSIPGFSQDL